jgi:RNA polymerase sigma factor (sigma-70 family)
MPAAASEPSDEQLMLAYAAGDAAAFDRLYGRHKGGVYRYLLRQSHEPRIADEMFQDVWMSVIRARLQYTPTAKFTTWLYRVAHNRLIDNYRASGQVTLVSADDESNGDAVNDIAAAPGLEPPQHTERRELAERLRAALKVLPYVQREAFLLQQEGGLSLDDIAELTGTGMETVKSRLRYAVAKLRAALDDLREDAR